MAANRQLMKKTFLVLTTVIVAITCVVYLISIFGAFEHRKEMARLNIGEEIVEIHKGVPKGWAYSILTEPSQVGGIEPLGQAIARVDFSLPELNEKLGGEVQKRSIYFYPDKMAAEIEQQLERKPAEKCDPEYYARTAEYIILSSPCEAFQGEQYADIELKLKRELEEFWFKFQ